MRHASRSSRPPARRPLRIFRHVECEGPGTLTGLLDRQQIPWQLVRIDQGEPVPPRTDDVAGLIFMGGGMSVNDPLDWIADELVLIESALQADVPVLGICLGSQLLARALDAQVAPGDSGREIGWHPVYRIAADHDRWLQGLPATFTAFHWHGETFALPDGARLLLGSDCYRQQAFAHGNSLGLQFHVEMTPAMVRDWVQRFGDQLQPTGAPQACLQPTAQLLAQTDSACAGLSDIAARLLGNWLQRVERHAGY